MLIVLAGLPGVGKSTLAHALGKRLDALILDKDSIRDAIFPPSEVDYSDPQNALATEVMFMVAGYILERHPDTRVILDGKPFSREAQRMEARELAERAGSDFRLIHCVAPDALARQRLEAEAARNPENVAADRTFAKYLRIKKAFEPITMPHLLLDTSHRLEDEVELCARYVLQPENRS